MEKAKIHILFYESCADISGILPYFSKLRQRKFLNFINPKAKLQQAAAELAVCAAMKDAGLAFLPPEYGYDSLGKPCIKDGFIGISHTVFAAVSAVFCMPVGLDMGLSRFVNPLLAGKILNRGELSQFVKASDRNEFLLKTWVAKESFLKLTGQGLRKGMRHISYDIISGGIWDEGGKSCFIMQRQDLHTDTIYSNF